MAKTVKLLLTENVDNLGIVGDVVNVRLGYARNFLLPRDLATVPTEAMIADLADKRKQAEADLAELRKRRQAAIQKIDGLEITMSRSCNDQGQLYGSVTQQDIASALSELGFAVRPREVRLAHTIKRVDTFEVLVKFDTDLEANVKLWVVPDRELDLEREEEMEFDNEGNLIEKKKSKRPAAAEAAKQPEAEPADA
ncbi:MAG: 50S ribosomal protein L9 [Phycisphaerae bacterium]|nr:50S ribosomal protein L9 [Phycisphaerae bacterium]